MCDKWNFAEQHDPRLKEFKSVTFVMETTLNAVVAGTMITVGTLFDHGLTNFQNQIESLVKSMDDAVGGTVRFSLITFDDDGAVPSGKHGLR